MSILLYQRIDASSFGRTIQSHELDHFFLLQDAPLTTKRAKPPLAKTDSNRNWMCKDVQGYAPNEIITINKKCSEKTFSCHKLPNWLLIIMSSLIENYKQKKNFYEIMYNLLFNFSIPCYVPNFQRSALIQDLISDYIRLHPTVFREASN